MVLSAVGEPNAFTLGSDLLTFGDAASSGRIAARPAPPSASKFLPRSGRRMIRDTLIALIEHTRTELEKDGLELIVDVVDEQAEQQLWRKDDAAWYWLAAGGPNTLHTSETDVLRRHNATLRRIVDPESLAIVEEHIELSKLPPDPEYHAPLEKWVASKPKEDIVWEYLQSTMRLTLRLPASSVVPDDRMRMELNSVTLYIYLVTMNPSAYGTHVRTLYRGAFHYALHHLLAARHLARSADEYVGSFVGDSHKPLVSGVLGNAEVNRCLDRLLEVRDDNKDDSHSEMGAAKAALIGALEKTAFIQTVQSMLQRNTVRVDKRDPNFAYVFGLYKTLALMRCMCKWVANSSRAGSSKMDSLEKYAELVALIDRVDSEMRRDMSQVGQDEGSPLGEVSQRASVKLMRRVSATALVFSKLKSYSQGASGAKPTYSEKVYLVRLLSEALHSTAMYYARLHFAMSIVVAAKPAVLSALRAATLSAKFALAYQKSILRFDKIKRMLADDMRTVSTLLSSSTPTRGDVEEVLRCVLRIKMLGGIERGMTQRQSVAAGTAMSALRVTPLVATQDTWRLANDALWKWHATASEKADALGYDRRRGSGRIDLSKFGESTRFGAQDESRTESTIRCIDIFFITGLYQTLDTLDGKVGKIIFDTGRDEDGKLVTTQTGRNTPFGKPRHAEWERERADSHATHGDYRRKISELRSEVVLLLEIMRNGAHHGVSTAFAGSETRTKHQQAHLVRNACAALTQVLKHVLSRSTVGLVFSICSNLKMKNGQTPMPIGVTTRMSEEENTTELSDASALSTDLADTLVGPRATKLHSFSRRAEPATVPDFAPKNRYIWDDPPP
jgi:hypothetical protein